MLLRALRNLLVLPFVPFLWLADRVRRPRGGWLLAKLSPRIVELPRPEPWWRRYVPRPSAVRPTSLETVRRLVHELERAPEVRGLVLELPPLASGWVALRALRELILRVRRAGKEVVVHLPSGGGNRELFVASAASRVLLGPSATLAPLGLAASRRHLKGLLERLGVGVEVYRRADFKTAAEGLSELTMSAPQREQVEALLATYESVLVEALSERPGLDAEKVAALFRVGLFSGQAAIDSGLVDGLVHEDELAERVTGEKDAALVAAPRWLALRRRRWLVPVLPRPYVAVVPVHGAISDGPGPGASKDAVVSALRVASEDRRALGVVLHVDSPGGSALASDVIAREVERLKEKKPVVACFTEVAASGGYYVSAGAHAIVADPLTVTGSIGVISARLVASGLLERLGVHTEVIRRAPHADLLLHPRAATGEERAMLDREIDAFYRTFVGVVARGRRRSEDEIEPLARGRVWSGRDAEGRGLVDRLGGVEAAEREVRARLGREDELERVVIWPRPLELPPPRAKTAAELEALLGGPLARALGLDAIGHELVLLLDPGEARTRVLAWSEVPRID